MRAVAQRLPFHYGWLIVGIAILSNAAAGGAMFWTTAVYVPEMSEDFGVGRTVIVSAFMVGQLVFAVVGPFTGRFIDRNGAMAVMRMGAVLVPGALILTSFSVAPWQVYLGWALANVGRTFVMPIPFNWVLTRWFEGRRRQTAIGLVTVGFGMGGAVLLPIYKALAEAASWHATMLASGLLLGLAQLLAVLLIRNRPADLGLRPVVATDERREDEETEVVEWGLSAPQAFRTPVFWLLSIGLMLFFIGQGSITTLVLDFFDSRNVAAGAAALSLTALIRTVARIPLGLGLGRVRRLHLLAVSVIVSQCIATFALIIDPQSVGLVVWVVLWGIGGAFAPMMEPLLITRTFGVRHFGAVSGSVAMVATIGQVFGTIGGAALFDALGSYTLPFLIYATGVGVAAVLIASLGVISGRPAHRARLAASGQVPAPIPDTA